MLDRPVIAFDIETIPDPDVGRRLLGLDGTDADVVHEMVRQRLEETEGSTEYPQLPWHRVVTVCATILDPSNGHVEMRALGGDVLDERSHIEGFFRLVSAEFDSPRIVSWNGNGFDLPVMRYRSMMSGIAAPEFYRTDGPRKWNNYQSRYHDLHVDVMDVLSGYGASMRIGLGTIGKALGLSGKSFLDRPIYAHILDGDGARVVEYCKNDTLETLLVFLAWGFHAGWVSPDQLRAVVEDAREVVSRESFDGWRDVERALWSWPPWMQRLGSATRLNQHEVATAV
jgi:predicted PolB exonuclease-like 3'-5' exonuclease